MHVAMIDPSLFTLPYDLKLIGGLTRQGHTVDFYGKPVPPEEVMKADTFIRPHFYRPMTAWQLGRLPGPLAKAAKGLCHLDGMRRLVRDLKSSKPDVIHFQWLPLPLVDRRFLGALRRIAPLVITAHDSQPFNANPGAALQQVGATSVLGAFDRVIVHTAQAERRLLHYGVRPERIRRVAHGFLNDDQPMATPPAIDQQAPVRFVLFGKIKPYKGVDLLIEAVRQLRPAAQARCEVLVIGRPYMDTTPLTSAAAALGDRIRFDFRFVPDDELLAVLNGADVLIFPYREIDMSGVLMAALRTGRPIVASNIGGFAELLEHERNALLVPPDDVPALTQAIERIILDGETRRALSAGVAALAAEIPDWDTIAGLTTAVYQQSRGDAETPLGVSADALARRSALESG
jgi:glycosyltransferase involved in cell wall biosynthesis